MTVESLIERLKTGKNTPLPTPLSPQKLPGVGAKIESVREQNVQPSPPSPLSPQKVEGQSENQNFPSNWTPQPQTPDPGMARLMALAMALCDRTGATDKVRQDWRSDIEAAAPEHRGYLLALVRSLMPKPTPTAVVAAQPPAPEPLPKFHIAQPWNAADKAYQAHHWSCTTCKTVARSGHSDRCATGQQLHQLCEQAFEAGKVSK